ncbi:glutamate receptor 3.7 isoform X2 [Mercurialis annua]|uniref:glutamate receptor 3.7 isoform X2 n=1 Tax=Mercurialis annua TaxID=3986 RepID=UPI002160AECA|nr:glutamate receptor 3.7 isoform X2 [Mercurialis annua]
MEKPITLFVLIWVVLSCLVSCQRPEFVNVGAVFSFDSVIGRAAKPAMEAAVSDINKVAKILNGTELRLLMEDAQCNVFLGSVGAFQVLGKEVVTVIGPQSSGIAHMISQIANGLQVPLVSYAATDPTLSALQFPFFVRTTQSDSYQMAAMAELIAFYGWKEIIAIYVDDDPGRNGVAALEDELEKNLSKMYKMKLSVSFDEDEIMNLLRKSKLLGPRVYVVHVNPDPHLRIFKAAKKLQMMTYNYVWFATDWLSATIDSFSRENRTSLNMLDGVVGLRQHIPESSQKRAFLSRWKEMQQNGSVGYELNNYGLQAYDTVWAVAYAIDRFIDEFNNITFSSNHELLEMKNSELQLGQLKVFNGGTDLLNKILQTNFTGLSGHIQINQDRNIDSGGFDVINIARTSIHTVGYWFNSLGFSLLPPESLQGEQLNHSYVDQKLQNITWPGGKMEKPRGWVIADDERPLRIGVPYRASFVEFVTKVNESHIEGYSIDVFLEARKLIPYEVPYKFELFGDGRSNPSYNELTRMVAKDVFDAAVGDISIVTNRTRIVDFSQPYAASGLVIVAPFSNSKSSAWVFIKPFTLEMWCATAASFVMIAVVIWILEHRVNDEFRGPPRRQIITMFMFSFSTLFKTNQETTVSPLGRMVMIVWLFLLMVITASYTASLTSILTIQQLPSPITGIDSLIASDWPIGYQVGSFAYGYLSESLYIPRSRLVPLGSPEEYERALRLGPQKTGGVAAVIDELPYIELFLAKQSDFGIIGQPFTRGGWGFAFQRDSPLAIDMSTAILQLSETGKLQKIHEKWFCKKGCPEEKRQKSEPNQLNLTSFWGLYLLCGIVSLAAILLFLLRALRQFLRFKRRQILQASPSIISPSTRFSHVIFHFLDFVDEKEEAIKRMFTQWENPIPPISSERSNP